jgi:hypothetical protein
MTTALGVDMQAIQLQTNSFNSETASTNTPSPTVRGRKQDLSTIATLPVFGMPATLLLLMQAELPRLFCLRSSSACIDD